MNRVTLYKRPNKKLELSINGIVVKDNFTTQNYDSTTQSEINDVLRTADGTNRLSGNYSIDGTISLITTPDNILFDGTNQFNIKFIDETF